MLVSHCLVKTWFEVCVFREGLARAEAVMARSGGGGGGLRGGWQELDDLFASLPGGLPSSPV